MEKDKHFSTVGTKLIENVFSVLSTNMDGLSGGCIQRISSQGFELRTWFYFYGL